MQRMHDCIQKPCSDFSASVRSLTCSLPTQNQCWRLRKPCMELSRALDTFTSTHLCGASPRSHDSPYGSLHLQPSASLWTHDRPGRTSHDTSKVICNDIGLKKLEEMVCKDFSSIGPYLIYILQDFVILRDPFPSTCQASAPCNVNGLLFLFHLCSPPDHATQGTMTVQQRCRCSTSSVVSVDPQPQFHQQGQGE